MEEVVNDVLDACVNPIANMMCSLLVMQARKGLISRDEARLVVASSVDVLTGATITDQARQMGADMLERLLKALELQTKDG